MFHIPLPQRILIKYFEHNFTHAQLLAHHIYDTKLQELHYGV